MTLYKVTIWSHNHTHGEAHEHLPTERALEKAQEAISSMVASDDEHEDIICVAILREPA